MKKIYKPSDCEKCPVVIVEKTKTKTKIICGVLKCLNCDNDNFKEKEKMYKNCPLEWDS